MSQKMPSSVLSKSSINGISSPFVPSFLKAGPCFWEVLDKSIEKYGRTGGGVVCQAPGSAGDDGQSRHSDIFGFNFQGAAAGSLVRQGPSVAPGG